jgi:four helix bundle protein
MGVKNYRDLIVWQKAMDLVTSVYQFTDSFPQREVFGLTNQVRRAAVSVPSNIAEGQGRNSIRDFRHFLSIARGSLQEVETQLELSRPLKYLGETNRISIMEQSSEVARLINGLSRALVDSRLSRPLPTFFYPLPADCYPLRDGRSSGLRQVRVGDPSWGAGVNRLDLRAGPMSPRSRHSGGYGTLPSVYSEMRANFQGILRKEVIQPQVPLRLPCYDLVPITGFIFGACLAAPATSDAPRFGGLTGGVYKAQEHIHRGMLIRDY